MTGVSLSDKKSNVKSFASSFIAGAIAGAVAKSTIAPLDRTKINFQICSQKYSTKAAFKFILKSYKNEGIVSLWRGNSATMARIIPYAAIQFSSHEQWKKLIDVENSKARRFLVGSLAGVTSQTLTYPLDLARARMAVAQKGCYNSLLEVFVSIWRMEGINGFYKGYVPTILGVIPYAGVSFYTFGILKKYIQENYGEPNAVTNLMCGAAAGMLGQTSSYPLDIVRRRMQVSVLTGQQYNSIKETLVKVYKEEGFLGIYKGLSMNWVKGPIAVGISFATYEYMNEKIKNIL